ncbi:MAG: Gfo/Idh/MocA family protein [Verrucomicrobiales bacterium]
MLLPSRQPNIAVIGAGAWGKNLVKTLHRLGVLRSVIEASPDLLGRLGQEYADVTLQADYTPVLHNLSIDAVVISTPASTHYELAAAFLSAGKDVFIEKPMTLKTSHARDLIKRARQFKRVLMVGHLLLYKPAVQFLKQQLEAKSLGKLYSIHQERAKFGRVRAVENALWSLGVHDIAVLLHLVGCPPVRIVASGQSTLRAGVEDDVYLHLEFPHNIQAHLHCSWLWPEDRRRLILVGERGMLIYDEHAERIYFSRKTVTAAMETIDEGTDVIFEAAPSQPLLAEMQHFLSCVQTREQPLSDGESGLEVIKVLEAAALDRSHKHAGELPTIVKSTLV